MSDAPCSGGPRPRRLAPYLIAVVVAVLGALLPGFSPSRADSGLGCAVSATQAAMDASELQLLQIINDYRAQNGLTALQPSAQLALQAAWKSNDLGAYAYWSHDDLRNGVVVRTMLNRFVECGYAGWTRAGENLAAGYTDAASVFAAWKGSPAHNSAMLNTAYRYAGVGRTSVPGSPYGTYWTMDFGDAPGGSAAPVSSPATPTPPATPAPSPGSGGLPPPLSAGATWLPAGWNTITVTQAMDGRMLAAALDAAGLRDAWSAVYRPRPGTNPIAWEWAFPRGWSSRIDSLRAGDVILVFTARGSVFYPVSPR